MSRAGNIVILVMVCLFISIILVKCYCVGRSRNQNARHPLGNSHSSIHMVRTSQQVPVARDLMEVEQQAQSGNALPQQWGLDNTGAAIVTPLHNGSLSNTPNLVPMAIIHQSGTAYAPRRA
ncbi:hypothetical protein EV426DRAFT_571142 [Tirmania nivea]|nr:hypothetical protein EV426DRAFT_571142 [Tirmania nivea]